MHAKTLTIILLFASISFSSYGQYTAKDTNAGKFFIGSTLAILGNFLPENKPDFVQLNLGYRITSKDVVSLELKTWKYAWPLGTPPYGDFYEAPGENFPGHIREFGVALAYQRYLWKGLYTGIHVMNAFQRFVDEEGNKIGNGFQLFNTYRIGYHIKLFNDRFFLQPSLAITHRPFHTEMPAGFKQQDDKWSKFVFGEPGMHFGFNF